MSARNIKITRPGRHLSVIVKDKGQNISAAESSVNSMRAFELIATGKDPQDLPFITSRICGNHSASLAICGAMAVESAFGIDIPDNARILRNVMAGLDCIQSHIRSFFLNILPDYVDLSVVAGYTGKDPALLELKKQLEDLLAADDIDPFEVDKGKNKITDSTTVLILMKHYMEAFEILTDVSKASALIGGRSPMPASIIAGGVTTEVTMDLVNKLLFTTRKLIKWINNAFLSDILAIAPSLMPFSRMGLSNNFISFGGMPTTRLGDDKFFQKGIIMDGDLTTILNMDRNEIKESVENSWYQFEGKPRHPSDGKTKFDTLKPDGRSFNKTLTYRKRMMESGPLARMLVNQDPTLIKLSKDLKIQPSVLMRIAAYAIETKLIADSVSEWIIELAPGEPTLKLKSPPPYAEGISLVETPDGSTGMWLRIEQGRINHFQFISGSTWNLSPGSEKEPGPVEGSVIGLDPEGDLDILRTVRSFNPCTACSAH